MEHIADQFRQAERSRLVRQAKLSGREHRLRGDLPISAIFPAIVRALLCFPVLSSGQQPRFEWYAEMTAAMPNTSDRAELDSIRRFRQFQLFGRMIDEAAHRAEAHARLEVALQHEATHETASAFRTEIKPASRLDAFRSDGDGG